MKDDFLVILEDELKNNGFENTDEILEKYRKRYDFGIESGMTEEEIEERLGDPSDIVKKLMDDSEYKFEKENSCYKIEITTVGDDVRFVETNNDKARIHLEDIDEKNYEIANNDNGIFIKALSKKFFGLNRRRSGLITIELPVDLKFNKVILNSTSGDFISEMDIKAKNFELSFVSGDCDFKKIIAKNFEIHIVSGDAEIEEINADYASISSVSGDIDIDYLLSNDLKIDTVSGDIKIKEASYGMNIKTSAITGNIIVDGNKYKNFTTKVKEVFKSEPKK